MKHYVENSPFFDQFPGMEKRPGMYFGSNCVLDLFTYLVGWVGHKNIYKDKDYFSDFFYLNFHEFVGQRFGYGGSHPMGWAKIIFKERESDEARLALFLTCSMILVRRIYAKNLMQPLRQRHGRRTSMKWYTADK